MLFSSNRKIKTDYIQSNFKTNIFKRWLLNQKKNLNN